MFNYSLKPVMAEKLRLFREHGFEYLHRCDDWNNDRLYTREQMGNYSRLVGSSGLTCLDAHETTKETTRIDSADATAHRTYVKLLMNRVEFCSRVGGGAVVVHPPKFEGDDLERRLGRAAEAINRVEGLCRDLGILIVVENCFAGDERIIEVLLGRYDPELMGFCFDSGHANILGNQEQLFRFGGRLRALHLHDNRGQRGQPPATLLGYSRLGDGDGLGHS